jgi:hypothetical protein
MPFEDRDPLEVWGKVREGEREIIPSHVPARLRNLITSCWSATPLDRPSFSEILEILKDMNADNKRHRSATLHTENPPSSSSSLPYGKINLGIGSQTFVVDEPMTYKMNSAIKCHDLSNNDTLLSSLPTYVIPARLVDVTFMNSRAAIGISKYMDMYSAAVLPCVTILFSIVLREMRGTRMSHVFLYDKSTLKVMDENRSETVITETDIKGALSGGDIIEEKREDHSNGDAPKFLSVRTILSAFHSDPIPRRKEDLRSPDTTPAPSSEIPRVGCAHLPPSRLNDLRLRATHFAVTPFFYRDLEAVVFPIDPHVTAAMVCHVKLRNDMKTVASSVYGRKLVPWAMRRGLWRGGLTLTDYNAGQVLLVNLFRTENDCLTFIQDGSYDTVIQELGTFLLELPTVQIFAVERLHISKLEWIWKKF